MGLEWPDDESMAATLHGRSEGYARQKRFKKPTFGRKPKEPDKPTVEKPTSDKSSRLPITRRSPTIRARRLSSPLSLATAATPLVNLPSLFRKKRVAQNDQDGVDSFNVYGHCNDGFDASSDDDYGGHSNDCDDDCL